MAAWPAAPMAPGPPSLLAEALIFMPCDPLCLPTKRGRIAPDFRCLSCSTSDTSVMRTGPAGPKTLCNKCGLRYRKQLETQAHVKKRMSIATLCTDGPEAAPKSASAATSPRLHWDVEEATADAAKSSSAQEAAKPAIAGRVSPLGMS